MLESANSLDAKRGYKFDDPSIKSSQAEQIAPTVSPLRDATLPADGPIDVTHPAASSTEREGTEMSPHVLEEESVAHAGTNPSVELPDAGYPPKIEDSSLQQERIKEPTAAAGRPSLQTSLPLSEPSQPAAAAAAAADGLSETFPGAAAAADLPPHAPAMIRDAPEEDVSGDAPGSSSGSGDLGLSGGGGLHGLPPGSFPPVPPLRVGRALSSESVGPSSNVGAPPLVTTGKLRMALFQKLYRRGGSRAQSEASSFPPTPRTSAMPEL